MIGFKLPQGTRTIHGHPMNLDAHPWGWNGDQPTPGARTDGAAWTAFRNRHIGRYGPPLHPEDPSLVSFPGLEHPQYQSYLEVIAERNPAWFEQQGLGKATGTTASTEEVFDAQAWEGRARIEEEGRRLFMLDKLPDLPGTPTPTPPTPGPAPIPSSLPPLSPLSVRVGELRTWLREEMPLAHPTDAAWRSSWRRLLQEPAWTALKPFAVEALLMWRLLRRHLGDTRPLPGRE